MKTAENREAAKEWARAHLVTAQLPAPIHKTLEAIHEPDPDPIRGAIIEALVTGRMPKDGR
jgi:hypothetical protein